MATKKEQLKIGELKKTPLNLIQQEFYSRFPQVRTGVVIQPHASTYYELRKIQTDNGIIEKLVEVDYPITQDYVNSFAQSADYHSDINAASALPPPGANLNDLCGIQELLKMDTAELAKLKSKVDIVAAETAKQKTAPAVEKTAPAVDNTEVKNV